MNLINQSVEIWKQPGGEVGIYKQVEKAARLCYKSEDKITEDSYKKFIDMISSKGHYSPFEHGTVYLKMKGNEDISIKYQRNHYSRVSFVYSEEDVPNIYDIPTHYITTNYRVIKENGWEEDLKYLSEPTEYHVKRISVHITTSIGISRELNRHRCHSICEESTRYCNYSKDKFGNELTFIQPSWMEFTERGAAICKDEDSPESIFIDRLEYAEDSYLSLLKGGWTPQQAREALPLSTKTELIHTAFEDDWKEFFKLRCSSAAHPMMQELANKINELINGIC